MNKSNSILTTLILLLTLTISCKKENNDLSDCKAECPSSIIDARDGTEYPVIKLGCNCWMQKNLAFKESGVCYDNLDSNCDIYGALYLSTEIFQNDVQGNDLEIKGICPAGWHISTIFEWRELIDSLGGSELAGVKLKSVDNWRSSFSTGVVIDTETEKSGFDAQPAGSAMANGNFRSLGFDTEIVTSSINTLSNKSYVLDLRYNSNRIEEKLRTDLLDSNRMYSCRCVED